jgi:hypothetical protein
MIKFPKDFPSNIRNILSGFLILNFGAYFLTFLIVKLTNLAFVKEVGLISLYTLFFMDLFFGWLIIVFIGIFIWRGPILKRGSKIILLAVLGYSSTILLLTNIGILYWDTYPYRPKVQVKSDGQHPQEISLDFIDLRSGKGEKNPNSLPAQE